MVPGASVSEVLLGRLQGSRGHTIVLFVESSPGAGQSVLDEAVFKGP